MLPRSMTSRKLISSHLGPGLTIQLAFIHVHSSAVASHTAYGQLRWRCKLAFKLRR